MIQSLDLTSESEIKKISSNAKDRLCIKSLIWIIVSIEGFLGLRYGRIPVSHRSPPTSSYVLECSFCQTIAQDTFDYALPSEPQRTDESAAEGDQFYFTAFCELGHICSLICRIRTDASNDDLSQLQSLLNTWKSSFSSQLQKQGDLKIWFHEAIFGLELMSFASKTTCEHASSKSMLLFLLESSMALSSARDMLRSLTSSSDVKEAW